MSGYSSTGEYASSLPFTGMPPPPAKSKAVVSAPEGYLVNSTAPADFAAQTNFTPLLAPPTDGNNLSVMTARIIYAVLLTLAILSTVFLIVATDKPEMFSQSIFWNGAMANTHFGYFTACVQIAYTWPQGQFCDHYYNTVRINSTRFMAAARAFVILADVIAGVIGVLLILLPFARSLQTKKAMWAIFSLAFSALLCTIVSLSVFFREVSHDWPHDFKLEYAGILAIVAGCCQFIIAVILIAVAGKGKWLELHKSTQLPL